VFDPNEFIQLCQLDLRRPLRDPAPTLPPSSRPVKQNPPLGIQLAGTIVETGHNQALIAMPDGSVELKRVGDEAGGARLRQITEGSVTVEYFGQQIVLTVASRNTN
jgi:hypothetical protein